MALVVFLQEDEDFPSVWNAPLHLQTLIFISRISSKKNKQTNKQTRT